MSTKALKTALTTGILVGGLLMMPATSLAQGVDYSNPPANSGTSTDIQQPQNQGGQGQVQDQGQAPGGGATTLPAVQNFDWRWLLLLLAIPIIYIALRAGTREDDHYSHHEYAVGAKGGRVKGTREEIEEEEV